MRAAVALIKNRTPRLRRGCSSRGSKLAVAAAAVLLAAPLGASLVKECSFLTLHRDAGTIFHGRCLAKKEVPDGQPLPYTEYTFEVLERVKGCKDARGKPLGMVTFRHGGTRTGRVRADGLEEAPLRFGIPEHEVGEESVLFLTSESSAGLCAPVGLSQGKFEVVRENRKARVKNPRGAALFETVQAAAFQVLEKEEADLLRSSEKTIDLKRFLGLCGKVKA